MKKLTTIVGIILAIFLLYFVTGNVYHYTGMDYTSEISGNYYSGCPNELCFKLSSKNTIPRFISESNSVAYLKNLQGKSCMCGFKGTLNVDNKWIWY